MDPLAMLKAAASRVRDPVSGRSIWLAGMVSAAKVRPNGDLQCELMFESAHAPHDRKGMTAALEANLAAVGFTGRLHALHGLCGLRMPRAPLALRHGVRDHCNERRGGLR